MGCTENLVFSPGEKSAGRQRYSTPVQGAPSPLASLSLFSSSHSYPSASGT